MNIEKLQMCRLCLVEDVRMFNVTNKDLQKLYEKLTDVPFVTEDSRPMLACVFCYTRLKQCCQLQRKCLEAEKMLTEMLNKDHETKPQRDKESLEYFNGYVISPTEHVNCVLVECQSESNDIKEEFPDDCEEHNDINEIKEEHQTEFEYQDSCPDLEDMTTNHSESDSEDDTPVLEFFKEEETDVSENKRRAEETQSAPDASKKELYVRITRLEDTATAQYKKTERNTQRSTTTDCSKMLNVNNTAIATKKGKQKYECDVCQRSYTIKSKLINHIRIHTGEKPFKCDKCQKSFTHKIGLKIHYRTHSGEKRYKCGICHRNLPHSHHLKENNGIHCGENPYKCEECQRSFAHRVSFNAHIRRHTGEIPYKCDLCQKSFNRLSEFRDHKRVHTGEKPYKCEICLRSYAYIKGLNKHVRIHTGEKPYKCDVCQRSFTLHNTLISHIRIHIGEKPYKCDKCQRSFYRRSTLISHIRIHTAENLRNVKSARRVLINLIH